MAYSADLLFTIRWTLADVAHGPRLEADECPYWALPDDQAGAANSLSPVQPGPWQRVIVWPWGLGFNLAVGVVFFWIAVHRLRTPFKTLPKGTRVA
jgi:hypothetical protein